jgi:hypothetical protein
MTLPVSKLGTRNWHHQNRSQVVHQGTEKTTIFPCFLLDFGNPIRHIYFLSSRSRNIPHINTHKLMCEYFPRRLQSQGFYDPGRITGSPLDSDPQRRAEPFHHHRGPYAWLISEELNHG